MLLSASSLSFSLCFRNLQLPILDKVDCLGTSARQLPLVSVDFLLFN